MSRFTKYYEKNQKMWDEAVKRNVKSPTYRVNEFLDGETTLNTIELEEVGNVKGKSLLHLQCHFGLDTISWARKGAKVTGVDFSPEAINKAEELSEKTGVEARFILANIYDLPDILNEKFDIVFTSYGVHCWLNDIERWAEIVAHFLKPGGVFYIAEFHPFIAIFDYETKEDFDLKYSYFKSEEPYEYLNDGTVSESEENIEKAHSYEWNHGIGKVVTAIVKAGLQIEFLHEFPMTTFPRFQFLKQKEDGYWYYDDPKVQLPLTFSIRATK